MSEIKEMVVNVVEKIFKTYIQKETVDLVESGTWEKEVWELLTKQQLLNLAIPESAEGAGGDIEDLYNVYYVLGKYAAPIPFVENTLANYLLYFFQMKCSSSMLTYCLPQDTLKLNDNQTVSGTLINVPWARHVKELFTFAFNSNGKVYPVVLSLQSGKITKRSNLAGEPRDSIFFEKANVLQINKEPLIQEQIHFFQSLDTAAKNALICGAIDKIVQLTIQYSKERKQFGQPIHRFQLVQQHLAILAGEQAIAKSCFENMVAGVQTSNMEVALTRIRLEESIRKVTSSAHQVHGAIGVTHEHLLHQYTRRLWAWRDEGYNSNFWQKQMAEELMNSKEDLWTFLTNS